MTVSPPVSAGAPSTPGDEAAGSADAATAPPAQTARLAVTKGHGTENDFVLLDDRDAQLDLTADLTRALTDRHAGLGGDGVIRLVASTLLPEGGAALAERPDARWFMDYRNADGSAAEMCGNGVRVFARYLERLGLWAPDEPELTIGTRAGARTVRRVDPAEGDAAWYAVDMGAWSLTGGPDAAAAGSDAEVDVPGLQVPRPGLRVDVGNPHTVVALADPDELAAADLGRAPTVTPTPAHGTNVELVVPRGEARAGDGMVVGRLTMRVHERGVGETRSCGTGACAAALAVRAWAGPQAPDVWLVEVPGGVVRVAVLPDGHVELAGPAVLVATAEVDVDRLTTPRAVG